MHHLGDGQNSGRKFMKRLGKGFITVLLVMLMILLGSSSVYAKESNEKEKCNDNGKGNDKKTIEIFIKNVSKDTELTVNETFQFEAKVKFSKNVKEKDKDGIVRWELSKDKAGVNSISIDGVVLPTKEGTFKVRALYFESEKTYKNWIKKQNNNLIVAASEWEKIKVREEEAEYTSPTLTLKGNDIMFVQVGEPFVDPGATAYDKIDGDISNKIVLYGGEIFTGNPGEFYLYYFVQNEAGYSETALRLVVVKDLTGSNPPVIKVNYSNIETIIGISFDLEYGTAWDYEDGNITSSMVIAGDNIDFNKAGKYNVILRATDSDGNTTEKTVIVVVQDPENPKDYFAPVLDIEGPNPYYMNVGEIYEEPGYYARDNYDTDIYNKVVINSNLNSNKAGTYQITYDATDAAGNVAEQIIRTVIVSDWVAPVLTLNGDPVIFVNQDENYVELGATAIDNSDGDISDLIDITNEVDTTVSGTYGVTYTITDSSGNTTSIDRVVVVIDEYSTPEPVIALNGYSLDFVDVGTTYQELGAIAYDIVEGDISEKVIIGGDVVDWNKEGIYYVTYDVVNSDGISAKQKIRKVIVTNLDNPIDYINPTIELIGETWITIEIGVAYIEPGYIAIDDKDGDITGNVIVEGSVDTTQEGQYELIYKVQDAAGNKTEQRRFVDVILSEPADFPYINDSTMEMYTEAM